MTYTIVIDGPDADQALAELRSNIEYDDLDVKLTVTPGWAGAPREPEGPRDPKGGQA